MQISPIPRLQAAGYLSSIIDYSNRIESHSEVMNVLIRP